MKVNLFKSYCRHNGTLVGHDYFVLYSDLFEVPSSNWSNVLKLWVLKYRVPQFFQHLRSKVEKSFHCMYLELLNTSIWSHMMLNALDLWGWLEFWLSSWKVGFRLSWLWREASKVEVTTEKANEIKYKFLIFETLWVLFWWCDLVGADSRLLNAFLIRNSWPSV